MPYIGIKTSEKLSCEKKTELKSAFGKAIEAIRGKTEAYLMVSIEDGCDLWLAGVPSKKENPMAFIDVRILGKASKEDFSRMTGELCEICHRLIGTSPANVYVAYEEYEHWGHNGKNF